MDKEHLLKITDGKEAIYACQEAYRYITRIEAALRILREYPDFDAGGPLPQMIDDVLEAKYNDMLEFMLRIENEL